MAVYFYLFVHNFKEKSRHHDGYFSMILVCLYF